MTGPAESGRPNDHSGNRGGLILIGLAFAAAALWLWVCWCLFPVSSWNDLRLAPSLAQARGVSFYPPIDSGALTTWMYGPLPVLIWLPAALAATPAAALLVAGAINHAVTLVAIVLTVAFWPAERATARHRLAAGLLCVAIWPFASFQYLQADNVAVAFGLVANLVLVRSPRAAGRWVAALLVTAALASKQTSVGIPLAQVLWVALAEDPRAALIHALRCIAAGLGLALAALAIYSPAGLWTNMVNVPGGLPWAPDALARTIERIPELSVQLVLPAVIMLAARRRLFRRGEPLALPCLAWLATLPLGLMGFYKFGGTLNSFQGFTLFLPAILLALLVAADARRIRIPAASAACLATLAIVAARWIRMDAPPLRPATDHYDQAAFLADNFPGEIWFPWNPLVTVYSEDRFYHVEDGITMRALSGHPITERHLRAHLPADLHVIALPTFGADWGIALGLKPPRAEVQTFGRWTLHHWTAEEEPPRP